MAAIVTTGLPEQIAEILIDKIIRFELKPGENIREAQIAQELKVSRSPVREALRLLEKYRLVEQIPRKGTRVTEITEENAATLYDIAIALIILAAKQCVAKCTPEDLKAIDETVQRAADAVARKDVNGYYSAFFDIAVTCLHAARNQLLEDMIMDIMPCIRRMQFLSFSVRSENLEENLEIVQRGNSYLQNGDGEMAVNTVMEYVTKEKTEGLKILKMGLHLNYQNAKKQEKP